MRLVVLLALDHRDPLLLAPARLHDPTWIQGGVRELHELAVAAAAAGYEAEVRGDFHGPLLDRLCAAAGVRVRMPDTPRSAEPDDIVCVPDGIPDPTFYLRVALMRSTPVYTALAPPGLFGWSFVPEWRHVDALDIDTASVGLPEHCRVIHSFGFRVWSNASTTAGAFVESGVTATVIGEASPLPIPPEPPKDVDVVTVGANRWASLTRTALDGFRGTWRELPEMPHERLITELGRGHVFVHCSRIEGHSRLGVEARLMGTCCVGLASNRFAVGFDETAGGAKAERIDEVADVVERMLADPEDLKRRQQLARATATENMNWPAFVRRVGDAVAAIEAGSEQSDGPWREVAGLLANRESRLHEMAALVQARRSVRAADWLGRRLRRGSPVGNEGTRVTNVSG